ncbi:hypothetical protein EJB05_25595, partial [Eragrostis curvula]
MMDSPLPPSSPRPNPSWVLLDRFVHRSRRRRGVYAGDPTTPATSDDCTGLLIRASLRAAAVSRLYLHWTGRPPLTKVMDPVNEESGLNPPIVVINLYSKIIVLYNEMDPGWDLYGKSFHLTDPTAVAAHRHAVLFRLTVPVEDPEWWHAYCCFPVDYFVYSASAASPPSLIRLPPCFEGGVVNPKLDKPFRPYRRQQQRCMLD